MKTRQVNEIMVPISEYATIKEDASMSEAIQSIESDTYLRIAKTDGSFLYGRVQKADRQRSS